MSQEPELTIGCRECHYIFRGKDQQITGNLYFCPKCQSARSGILLSVLESGRIVEGYHTGEEAVEAA